MSLITLKMKMFRLEMLVNIGPGHSWEDRITAAVHQKKIANEHFNI